MHCGTLGGTKAAEMETILARAFMSETHDSGQVIQKCTSVNNSGLGLRFALVN